MALFAGTLAPHPTDEQNFDFIEAKPGAHAPFGTDRVVIGVPETGATVPLDVRPIVTAERVMERARGRIVF